DAKVVVRPPTDHTRFCTLIFGSHGAAKSRSSLHRLCPTSRDFVPWRFSDAGRISAWRVTSCRRPRNLHITVHRRFQTWCCHEILRRVLTDVANELRDKGALDEEECFIDATFVMA